MRALSFLSPHLSGVKPGIAVPPVSVISSPITFAATLAVTRLAIVTDLNIPDPASEDLRGGADRTAVGTSRVRFPLVRWVLASRTTWQARRLVVDFGKSMEGRTAWAMTRLTRHPDEHVYVMHGPDKGSPS